MLTVRIFVDYLEDVMTVKRVRGEETKLTIVRHTVLVTGQLSSDLSAVISDLGTLFGTLNEDMLRLQ
jgi:hypothetical protein